MALNFPFLRLHQLLHPRAWVYEVLGIELRSLRMIGKHSNNGNTHLALEGRFSDKKNLKQAAEWPVTPTTFMTLAAVQPRRMSPGTLTAGTVCTQIRGPPACHSSLALAIFSFCKAQGLLGLDPYWACCRSSGPRGCSRSGCMAVLAFSPFISSVGAQRWRELALALECP